MTQKNQNAMNEPMRIILAAGGTGGHLFPASALAEELKAQGHKVFLLTDKRGLAYRDSLTDMPTHQVPAATIYSGGMLALPKRLLTLLWSLIVSLRLMIFIRPQIIIGFGGYPSFGPVIIGLLIGKPVLVHEQNAVLGRVNRLAVKMGASLATSFSSTLGMPTGAVARTRKTGNPLRKDVLSTSQIGYRSPLRSNHFDLLVFGGSQGARIFSTVVPEAIALLSRENIDSLRVVHQVSKENMSAVLNAYGDLRVASEIRDFFSDMPRRLRHAHLVICRGGASTISEICALGVPSIIVPLPGSLDQDQANNARALVEVQATQLIKQTEFSPQNLADILTAFLEDKAQLNKMSANAASLAMADATVNLARYALDLARGLPVESEQASSFSQRGRS